MSRKRKIETASASGLRRLSPAENVKLGYSAKAERYILKGAAVRKGAATVSKRQFLERQTAEREGFEKPISLERAASARRDGGAGYSSAAAMEQASKQIEVRALKRAEKVEFVRDYKGRRYKTGFSAEYAELRARKLGGEFIEQGDWCAMMDIAKTIKDPRLADLQSSAIINR